MTQSRTKNINYMEETMIIKFSCSKECTVTNSNLMHKRYQEVYSRQLLFLSISCLSFPHLIFYVSFMIGFMRHNICSSPFSVYAYHSSFWKLQLFNLLDQTTAKSSAVIYLKDYNDRDNVKCFKVFNLLIRINHISSIFIQFKISWKIKP